jgi:anti-sigma-K factor RskA
MAFDVFISYPHQDKLTADAACAKLEAEGIRTWIAPRDISPSADWAASIVDAIDNCRVMVLVFSGHTNRSRQVHREVQQAFDGEKPVVPFRIESVAPEKALRYYMGSVHWLDALTPPIEQHLEKLVASVVALVRPPTSAKEVEQDQLPREAATQEGVNEHQRQAEEDRRLQQEDAQKTATGADARASADDERHEREVVAIKWRAKNKPLGNGAQSKRRRNLIASSLIGLVVAGAVGSWYFAAPSSSRLSVIPAKTEPSTLTAILRREPSSAPAFELTIDIQSRTLTIRRFTAAPDSGRSYELWLVSAHSAKARSLGVINDAEITKLELSSNLDTDTLRESRYAVSLEPASGPHFNGPSGPIMFIGTASS